jgi:signal transduction histidine kinase
MSDADAPRGRRARLTRRLRSGLPVGQWLAFSIGALLILAMIGIGLALAANATVTDWRELGNRIAPAQVSALDLENALINEETGVRGFILTGETSFLQPYRQGRIAEARDYRQLLALLRGSAAAYAPEAKRVRSRAQIWQRVYAAPVLGGTHPSTALESQGKALFDAVRRALAQLTNSLAARRSQARVEVNRAARILTVSLIVAGVMIIAGLLAAAILLRWIVTAPLGRLGREARRVAGGDFETPLAELRGAREIVDVRQEVETMRELIVSELAEVKEGRARLQEQAVELQRSNADLEQFAYVASHDLQEPLRKVASFCQALQERYQGRLDERADQYIYYAVDGAKRMQILINDLLAFSRAGRSGRPHELVEAADIVEQARTSLSEAIAEAGATVAVAELPTVRADRALLVSVFQNLIANALKFHGSQAPEIRIDAHTADGEWEFSCSDNGIGIDPEYAERIFMIFQRLHTKESYPGTGIGLALCRRIVEYHGGRMWLDTTYAEGACLRFTLPIAKEVASSRPI